MAYQNGIYSITSFHLEETERTLRLTITPPADSKGLLPQKRTFILLFRDLQIEEQVITVANEPVTIELSDIVPRQNEPKEELTSMLLTRVQADNDWKNLNFKNKYPKFVAEALAELDTLWYPEDK